MLKGIFALFLSLLFAISAAQTFFSVISGSQPTSHLGIFLIQFFLAVFLGYNSKYLLKPTKAGKINEKPDTGEKPLRSPSQLTKEKIKELAEARLVLLKSKATNEPIIAVHVGGSGIQIQAGSAFYLSCRAASFAISHAISDEEIELPYYNIKHMEVSGPGTETTNAGLTGGGFGLEGALKGIAAAMLINAATTQKSTNTFLRIATNDGEAYFHFNNIEPASLRLALSPLAVAVEANMSPENSNTPMKIASELQKLNQLKIDGIITEDEFEACKSKIIAGI